MKFHKEGRVSIVLAALVSMILIVIAYTLFDRGSPIQPITLTIAAVLMLTILQFFRSPPRRKLIMDDAIIAPADGKVVVIEEVQDSEYFNEPVRQISIFMSPLHVHINWFPLAGQIIYNKYHPGKYLVAWDPKSSTDNERHSIVIENPAFGKVLVKQIAGAMARRIVNYSSEGQTAEQGGEMGFIKFGSRVDVLIPLSAKVEVKLDDTSIGGQTILASIAE
ncbi:MAG: phosphatidylserine decarboxylase family protein [Flavobacteriales bacterium]|jgi:phosphatidylserine decarboxylase|nr:phosphatidylserine decarboxylase family protein [Flavobacteriales bacterium]NCG30276.1 phosphatidylserine decarboxylase family protein [Bacteroidota bacterium]MBT3963847.1 phosphatidylserine decarboxylase family protein [Flavobacteriales bacterium]MBT4704945.1 phosphatidylserine decarboxylase family protein [Flavobacteriales bacterium]MBT4929720.1 phosphatidylserine decarboxylase family protein [Flavobacteriales bacterium]